MICSALIVTRNLRHHFFVYELFSYPGEVDWGRELLFPNSLTSPQLPWGGGLGNGVTLPKLTNFSAATKGRWTGDNAELTIYGLYGLSNRSVAVRLHRGIPGIM